MNHSSDADRQIIELGDFATPNRLARQLWLTLRDAGLRPRSLLDPRCGGGNLLLSGAQAFDPVTHFCGIDINRGYVERACNWLISERLRQFPGSLVFWDGERPITAMVLRSLDMLESAGELERDEQLLASMGRSQTEGSGPQVDQRRRLENGTSCQRTIEADTSDRRDNAVDHSYGH